jgi:uncharacterized protein YbjT (DUF2867 family)
MSGTFERVLVVGATGSIGRRVVATLGRHGLPARGLVRDLNRGQSVLPGVELVRGDLEQPGTLAAAVEGVDAVVFTHGGSSSERVDYGGVRNVLGAFPGALPRIALMTSIGVTQSGGGYRELLEWKRRSERLVRASGAPYTIVRPGWFDNTSPGQDALVLEQGDTETGTRGIGRDQLAEVLVRSLNTDTAIGRTFELFADAGPAPRDWPGLFAPLVVDTPGALDGARDRAGPDLDREPAVVQHDVTDLRARATTA